MRSPVLIFVSTFTRRIDQRRRLRLPTPWRGDTVQDWLLYPGHLIADAQSSERTLCLAPADARLARTLCDALQLPPTRPRTLATTLETLRAVALRRGLDPTVVTHHHTAVGTIHLTLSPAQLNWLRAKNRSFVLTGQLTTIAIWSEESYAHRERSASRRPGKRV